MLTGVLDLFDQVVSSIIMEGGSMEILLVLVSDASCLWADSFFEISNFGLLSPVLEDTFCKVENVRLPVIKGLSNDDFLVLLEGNVVFPLLEASGDTNIVVLGECVSKDTLALVSELFI